VAPKDGPRGRKTIRPAIEVTLPSETSFLALVRELTKKMAETAGFDGGTADRLALAVDEATTNVIEHAYAGASGKTLELRFEDSGPELRIDIVDTGAMVDPRSFPRVDLQKYTAERRTGGLGIHLMGKIMDSVTFRRTARKNVCRLVKRKEPSGEAEP
jgi:serine/threonine-protein kinase RsbW